jgi:ABC-type multidrug transport system fused ATPase/permease subunit
MGNLPKGWKQLDITNLSFSYHGVDAVELHVDNVSFPIRKAERIAIIGESGGGKSTVLKLIRDLYHPKTVTVSVDNKEIKNQFLGISNSVSLIPQDPEIFATTVRENITMGIDYSDTELDKFIQIGCFDEVIEMLPKGIDSSLVEKGVNLSGGQKQRLALVRGLIASTDKEIVLLDEPTSSVDMVNEINIYKNIFREFFGSKIEIVRSKLSPKISFFNSKKLKSGVSIFVSLNISKFIKKLPNSPPLEGGEGWIIWL